MCLQKFFKFLFNHLTVENIENSSYTQKQERTDYIF